MMKREGGGLGSKRERRSRMPIEQEGGREKREENATNEAEGGSEKRRSSEIELEEDGVTFAWPVFRGMNETKEREGAILGEGLSE